MAIKSGRVGVNPVDVDPVSGRINPSATDAYTKAQTDDKFLSKTDAASTYESKSDASTAHNLLQPKTLAVPIEMLSGTKLTVETALQGLNTELTDAVTVNSGSLTSDFTINENLTKIKKQGKICCIMITLTGVTANANTALATLSEGYRPLDTIGIVMDDGTSPIAGYIGSNGVIYARANITDGKTIRSSATFITN